MKTCKSVVVFLENQSINWLRKLDNWLFLSVLAKGKCCKRLATFVLGHCIAFCLVLSSSMKACNADMDANRLYEDLLSEYNRLIRPVANNSDRLTVKLGLKLSQLIDVVSCAYFIFCLFVLSNKFIVIFIIICKFMHAFAICALNSDWIKEMHIHNVCVCTIGSLFSFLKSLVNLFV